MPGKDLWKLFNDNPPRDDEEVCGLFQNRESELEWGLTLLRQAARPATGPQAICAVHGQTQTGKSHLVRRLLVDVCRERLPYLIFTVNANNRGTARWVLEELFCQLWLEIQKLNPATIPDGEHGTFEDVCRYLREIEPLVTGEAAERKQGQKAGHTSTGEAGFTLAPPGPLKLAVGGKVTTSAESVEDDIKRAPDNRNLVECLRYEIDALARLCPGQRVLIYIDDLDLLDRAGVSGSEECNRLIDLLKPLTELPTALVLVTVRQAYFNGREKDLSNFIAVKGMSPEHLVSVYRMRIDRFHEGQEVFTPEALAWLTETADEKVGMFLQRCYELFRAFYSRGTLIGKGDVLAHVREHIQELRRDPAHFALMAAIEEAVRDGSGQVTLSQELRDTAILHRVLHPLPGQVNGYSINSLYLQVMMAELVKPKAPTSV